MRLWTRIFVRRTLLQPLGDPRGVLVFPVGVRAHFPSAPQWPLPVPFISRPLETTFPALPALPSSHPHSLQSWALSFSIFSGCKCLSPAPLHTLMGRNWSVHSCAEKWGALTQLLAEHLMVCIEVPNRLKSIIVFSFERQHGNRSYGIVIFCDSTSVLDFSSSSSVFCSLLGASCCDSFWHANERSIKQA